ncbi:MAG: hypothetical protein KAS66_08290 [Candidatus Omnitrophica bacterium]|nr:hypothetical protein [Candidatus Omnitrophota bacterium]
MNKIHKPDLVILEGPDKAGKSTIYQAFRKHTHYQPLVIDRFIGSNIAYDQLHKRADVMATTAALYETEVKLKDIFNPLLVYLHAPVDVMLERSVRAGDIREEEFDIRNIQAYYERYMNNTTLPRIQIDTAIYTVEQIVEIIERNLSSWGE